MTAFHRLSPPRRSARPVAARLVEFVVWCLLLALPVYGLSGTIIQLIGPVHFHRAIDRLDLAASLVGTDSNLVLQDFRRADSGVKTMSAVERHELSHRQHPFARHRHAPDDTSVVVIDGSPEQALSEGDTVASAGSACLSLAVGNGFRLNAPRCTAFAWRRAMVSALPDLTPIPPERPPKA
jgi:hypothetical protein